MPVKRPRGVDNLDVLTCPVLHCGLPLLQDGVLRRELSTPGLPIQSIRLSDKSKDTACLESHAMAHSYQAEKQRLLAGGTTGRKMGTEHGGDPLEYGTDTLRCEW